MTTTLLCLASYFKGNDFLVAAKKEGAHVILLTREKLREKDWPRDSIDELFFMPALNKFPDIVNAVSYLARQRVIDQVIPLDDYDMLIAGELREHLRLPGMGATASRYVRDKLAMRQGAERGGVNVPAFIHVLNHQKLHDFMNRIPAPWLMKPRGEAGAMGIKKINHPDELWRWVDKLGDEQSDFLLEDFLPGDVYHVDSIIWDGKIVFATPHKYGRPPIDVAHDGGVFITRSLSPKSKEGKVLLRENKKVLKALGMKQGVAHTEFIRSYADGKYYFVETAGRVGGASISDLIAHATGINMWAEWCRVELAAARGEQYVLPEVQENYAGILVCLARQEHPDLSHYNDPEIVWHMKKQYHAGIIVKANDPSRVAELLNSYIHRFAQDFLAIVPALDKAPE